MESDSSSGGAADDDLLERARRLCLAAQLISDSLPKFPVGAARGGNPDEELSTTTTGTKKKPQGSATKHKCSAGGLPQAKGKGKTKSNTTSSNQSTLPLAGLPATPPPQVPRQRSLKKQKSVLNSTDQETLPEIAMSDEQRKAREAEKVRQAQERARARVARTNQSDQLEAEREIEMRRQQLQQLEEVSAEKERLAEQSRLRAEERVRMKRQLCTQLNPTERQLSLVCHPEKPPSDPAKIERFRRKTLARLRALPRNTTPKTAEPHHPEQGELVAETESPERDEDVEAETRKQKEKKLRQETAERIRRQQAVEEEQRRKEQELVQQGLLQYKNRQKELDRAVKGLGPPRKSNSVTKQSIEVRPHSGVSCEETVDAVQDQSLRDADEFRSGTQAMVGDDHLLHHGSGSFEQNAEFRQSALPEYGANEPHDRWTEVAATEEPEDQPPSLAISFDQHNGDSVPSVSSATSGGKRKLPPWKRAPVPVLPAEFYSSKVVIPALPSTTPSVLATASNSYTEKFKSRTPTTSSGNSNSSGNSAPSKLRATKPSSREATSSSSSAAASRPGSAARDRI